MFHFLSFFISNRTIRKEKLRSQKLPTRMLPFLPTFSTVAHFRMTHCAFSFTAFDSYTVVTFKMMILHSGQHSKLPKHSTLLQIKTVVSNLFSFWFLEEDGVWSRSNFRCLRVTSTFIVSVVIVQSTSNNKKKNWKRISVSKLFFLFFPLLLIIWWPFRFICCPCV